ncbi:MAG: metallophosphoesterase [Cyclobacteriaceae bacterium]
MKGRTFVVGDIHGAYRALKQCLERAGFRYEVDNLICLGDVADGWPETKQAVEELMKIKNLTYLLGNHDFWTLEWLDTGFAESAWMEQGGLATIASYAEARPVEHAAFFREARPYFVQEGKLFVHAGVLPGKKLTQQTLQVFLWDRTLARMAQDFHQKNLTKQITEFDEVYIGHTPIDSHEPQQYCEVWMMDTGAGWSGVLSIMDVATKEKFVSDAVPLLYPGVEGRQRK